MRTSIAIQIAALYIDEKPKVESKSFMFFSIPPNQISRIVACTAWSMRATLIICHDFVWSFAMFTIFEMEEWDVYLGPGLFDISLQSVQRLAAQPLLESWRPFYRGGGWRHGSVVFDYQGSLAEEMEYCRHVQCTYLYLFVVITGGGWILMLIERKLK